MSDVEMVRTDLFIGGGWVAPESTEVIEVVSPATEEVIGRAPHAAVIEAGLVPDWILPGVRNRGMRALGAPAQPRPRTPCVRAPP